MENLNERKRQILRMLAEDDSISVNDISKSLKVSAVTVRSDLSSLEDSGFIIRTRGGALPTLEGRQHEEDRRDLLSLRDHARSRL